MDGHSIITVLLLALTLITRSSGGITHFNENLPKADKLTGAWSDACPCKIPCSCWAKKRANVKMCVSVQVFQLSGWLEEFALRDSTFVLVNHPANPFDSPQPDVLYVDISTPAKALEAISRLFKYSFHLWPRKGLERVKIQSSLSPTVQRVTIRGILDYEVVAPSHADEKKLDVDLQENLYPWLQKPEQWLVREVTWKRNSEKTSYMGTNSIFATIESPRLVGSVNPVHPPPCSRGQRSDTNNVHFFARESFGFDYAQLHEYDTN